MARHDDPAQGSRALLSVVVPAHNEEENVPILYREILRATGTIAADVEIVFVDDGSRDFTRQVVKGIAAQDGRVKLVSFVRNFGHEAALLAGLQAAQGDAIITMDCDLQHPPELIPDMVSQWRSGFPVVQMVRDRTIGSSWGKRRTSLAFYWFMGRFADSPITPGASNFNLIDRSVVDDLLSLNDYRPFVRGMIPWLGYRRTALHYLAAPRRSGQTSYSYRKMLNLAVDAITAFSTKPLRMSFYLGCLAAVLSLLYLGFVLASLLSGHAVPGWTSLMGVVLLLGAAQLISLGVIGEYIGRIFDQTRGRPRFIIERTVGKN